MYNGVHCKPALQTLTLTCVFNRKRFDLGALSAEMYINYQQRWRRSGGGVRLECGAPCRSHRHCTGVLVLRNYVKRSAVPHDRQMNVRTRNTHGDAHLCGLQVRVCVHVD